MSVLPFVVKLATALAIGWALYVLLLILICVVFMSRRAVGETSAADVKPLEELDDEAFVSIDNDRRARVLSETGHLPPRLARTHVHSVRAAEDCQ